MSTGRTEQRVGVEANPFLDEWMPPVGFDIDSVGFGECDSLDDEGVWPASNVVQFPVTGRRT